MSFITDIFTNSVDKVVDSVGNAIDKLVTSDEERLLLRNELAKIQIEAKNKKDELDLQYEQEISKRHQSDMTSDSWLSKNIRPMSMVYLMALFTLAFFYNVPETTLSLLRDLLMTVFVFYFGSRTLEKVTSIIKDKK